MQCPIDHAELVIADRQGIEIDYCPKCRGVWLDRGELDKLIERATQYQVPGSSREQRSEAPREYREERPREHRSYDDDDDRHHGGSSSHGKHHKKESFFGELFDF